MDHRKKSGEKMWNSNDNNPGKLATTTTTGSSTITLSSSSTSTGSGSSIYYSDARTQSTASSSFSAEALSLASNATDVPAQTSSSSFILQRVERLYGPGALAQGFYARRSNPSSTCSTPRKDTKTEDIIEARESVSLPVLKLLRPEFRAQLTVTKRKSNSPVSTPGRSSDSTDGSVERVIPVIVAAENVETNKPDIENKTVIKDGNYYLKMVEEETACLERLAAAIDKEISSIPEHMEGRLRAAAGKARLLSSQKLAQFRGLCQKNINQDPSEDFPTTCEDLAGFWDMVSIQVKSVHEEFTEIDNLRKAGWPRQEFDGVKKDSASNGSTSRKVKSGTNSTKTVPLKSSISSSISKARDEARKRMLAERRKEMKKNTTGSDDVVIV